MCFFCVSPFAYPRPQTVSLFGFFNEHAAQITHTCILRYSGSYVSPYSPIVSVYEVRYLIRGYSSKGMTCSFLEVLSRKDLVALQAVGLVYEVILWILGSIRISQIGTR